MTEHPQLFDALPQPVEDALRDSIQRFGVLMPIVKDQHGAVIDGRHRERIAKDLGMSTHSMVMRVDDEQQAAEIQCTLNADRRHLSEDQRREVVATLRGEGHSSRAIAQALGLSKGTVHNDIENMRDSTAQHWAVDEPEQVRCLDGKVRPARRAPLVFAKNDKDVARAGDALMSLEDVGLSGRVMDTRRAERLAREQTAEQRRSEPVPEIVISAGDIDIRHGDFRETLGDLSHVDAIITDPPYPKEYVPLFGDLSEWASTVLAPHGVLAVLCGQSWLPQYFELLSQNLAYRWTCAYLHPGARTRVHNAKVGCGWKPVLLFQRRDATDTTYLLDDVFDAAAANHDGVDKQHHHWGQSEAGTAEMVERLTTPGALVVDPFLGGGTTAVACRDLGRRFVGCDVDAAAVHTSQERLG